MIRFFTRFLENLKSTFKGDIMYKIVMLDDHKLVTSGIKQLVDSFRNMKMVFHTDDLLEMEEYLNRNTCNVLILDVTLNNNVSGPDYIGMFKKIQKDLKILILTMHNNPKLCEKALSLGANGYLTKNRSPEELNTALKSVLEGKKYISQEIAQNMALSIAFFSHTIAKELLTRREFQIFRMLLKEYTCPEIAKKLRLSVKTIRCHKYNLFQKIGIKNDADFVRFVLKNNIEI